MTTKTHVPVLEQPLGLGQIVRDMVALTKPRITFMVAVTAAAGMWVAPGAMQPVDVLVALGALALVVGSANSFNCWLERDLDRLMARTKGRPLPAGRLSPGTAFTLAMMLMSVAVPLMMLAVNPLSGMLAVAALGIYVAVYTPLKTMTPAALIVGAVPGALPPLIGWTAMTGEIGAPGLVLFAIMFCWQMPHSIAISTFRREDYEAAGMRVLPAVRGDRTSRIHAVAWALPLLPLSLLLSLWGVTGWVFGFVAFSLSAIYLASTVMDFRGAPVPWARRVFFVSLVYVPAIFLVLTLDVVR